MPIFTPPSSPTSESRLLSEEVFRRTLRGATRKLALFLGLPALVWVGMVLVLIRLAERAEESNRVISDVQAVEASLWQLDAAERRARQSDEPSSAQGKAAVRERLEALIVSLDARVADRSEQAAVMPALRDRIAVWLAHTAAAPAPGADKAFELRSVTLLEEVRARLDTMSRTEDARREDQMGLRRWLRSALFITLVLFIVAGLPLAVMWLRRLLRTIGEAYGASLGAAERRAAELHVTLRSIGDAVVATNAAGEVAFLNPVAERLTGWTNTEAHGRTLSEVFVIFNQETGAPSENPVARVLRERAVVGIANHTVLRARGGAETPIEDSAAPILDDAGAVQGVVLVFHDVTERYAAAAALRTSEARFRFLHSLAEATRSLAGPGEIMATVARMLGLHLRASRCAYADCADDSDHFKIEHDYTDGCASTVGHYRLELFGPHAVAKLRAGETLIINDVDVELQPSQGAEMFNSIGIKALICCPLICDGGMRAMMAVHQTTPRRWTPGEISLVEEVVARCWAFVERQHAESALNASETLKTAIIDTSLDGFILMNHEGLILDWNRAAEQIFGASRAERVGKMLGDTIVPERLREAHRRGLARYVESREARILGKRYELPAIRADGSEFQCEISINHIPGTEPPLFAGYTRDITDRQQAAAALSASEERLRLVVESATDFAIFTLDLEGRVALWNPGAERLFGWPESEIAGQPAATLFTPEDRAAGVPQREMASAATAGRAEDERWHQRRDGSRFFASGLMMPLRDGGRTIGYLKVARDRTEQQLAEQERARFLSDAEEARSEAERAWHEAEAASKAKDDFLAALSHELRTPLTPVLMTAAALREDERLPTDAREQLGMIERNITLEARLIDDLLDLTRISKGKLPMRPQPCDAHSLIGLAVEIVRDEAQSKGIVLEREFGAQRSGLLADPARMQQVVWNLLRNAVKFTPRGGHISIRTRDDAPANEIGRLRIEITDTGIGIAAEALEKIFLPFEQAGLTNDHRFGGLGLGLSIARAIVDLHGGTLRAQSAGQDRGATFVVELPGAMEPPSGVHQVPERYLLQPHLPGIPSPQPALTGPALRILLVEDHEQTLQVLARLLSRAGHHIATASTVAEGRAAAAKAEFDLVISDLGLPDGTGTELMEHLQSTYGLRGIALSGYGMEDDLARSRAAGFALHLVKPVDLNQLQRALTEATTGDGSVK